MDRYGGDSRQQNTAHGDSDSRQNTSIRRRMITFNSTKEDVSDDFRPDEVKPCQSSRPEGWTQLEDHVDGPTTRRQALFGTGQRQLSGTESDGGNALPCSDLHMSLQTLALRLQALKEQDAELQQKEVKLKAQVQESEAVCGRMIQQYLEIARAIAMRKQHIQEDTANLDGVRQSRTRIEAQVTVIMAQISSSIHPGPVN